MNGGDGLGVERAGRAITPARAKPMLSCSIVSLSTRPPIFLPRRVPARADKEGGENDGNDKPGLFGTPERFHAAGKVKVFAAAEILHWFLGIIYPGLQRSVKGIGGIVHGMHCCEGEERCIIVDRNLWNSFSR